MQNPEWENRNERRKYPLEVTATADVPDLLADLRLYVSTDRSLTYYVGTLSSTALMFSLSVEAVDNDTGEVLPVGVASGLKSKVKEYSLVRLENANPELDSVGWAIPGHKMLGPDTFNYFFSGPEETLLAAHCVVTEPPSGSRSARAERTDDKLSGVVELTSSGPVSIKKESLEIDGVVHDNCIVFSLDQAPPLLPGLEVNSAGNLKDFAGKCGQRVGSESCDDPSPVYTINRVSPDADGVIQLTVTGSILTAGTNEAEDTIYLDTTLSLADTCRQPGLPDRETGMLPTEQDTLLLPEPVPNSIPPDPSEPLGNQGGSGSGGDDGDDGPNSNTLHELIFERQSSVTQFARFGGAAFTYVNVNSPDQIDLVSNGIGSTGWTLGDQLPPDFTSAARSVILHHPDTYTESTSQYDRSFLLLQTEPQTTDRRILTTLLAADLAVGGEAGIVLNLQSASTYLVAYIRRTSGTSFDFVLSSFSGYAETILSSITGMVISSSWVHIQTSLVETPAGAQVSANFYPADSNTPLASLTTTNYTVGTYTQGCGLFTTNSNAAFSFMRVDSDVYSA